MKQQLTTCKMSPETIRNYISSGNTKNAIEAALEYYKYRFKPSVILIMSRFNRIEKRKNLGLISEEFYQREISNINNSLIRVIDNKSRPEHISIVVILALSVSAIALLIFFISENENLEDSKESTKNEQLIDIINFYQQNLKDETDKVLAKLDSVQESETPILSENKPLKEVKRKIPSMMRELEKLNLLKIKAIKSDEPILVREINKTIRAEIEEYSLEKEIDLLKKDSNIRIQDIISNLESIVEKTNELGFSITIDQANQIDTSTLEKHLRFRLYPNPAHDHVYLDISIPHKFEQFETDVSIRNPRGEILSEPIKIRGSVKSYKLPLNLDKGMYYMVIIHHNMVETKGFVIDY